MSTLTGVDYGLAFDTLVEVQAAAGNSFGVGTASAANTAGAKTRRVPDAMVVPIVASVAESLIGISWAAVTSPADGNSPITAYNVYWDNGSGSTSIVLLDGPALTVSVPGLTGRTTYKFKIRAKNIYGEGLFSPELSVLASDIPD